MILNCLVFAGMSQADFQINGFKYEFKEESIDNLDAEGQRVKLYRIDSSGTKKQLLSHILISSRGDCNSNSLEIGDYKISDSTLTFYSFWCTMGDAPVSPYGARKQIYKIHKDGKITLQSSAIYIETTVTYWNENEGIQYLEKQPKNETERLALNRYIQKVEKEYHATFVLGDNAQQLISDVKEALDEQIQHETGDWDPETGFGIRR